MALGGLGRFKARDQSRLYMLHALENGLTYRNDFVLPANPS